MVVDIVIFDIKEFIIINFNNSFNNNSLQLIIRKNKHEKDNGVSEE
jgi:hypothetical protein